jgi:hypothetical protein
MMEYVTRIERLAKEENAKEMIIDLLQVRFGPLADSLIEQLNQIRGINKLRALHRKAISVESLFAFEQLLHEDEMSTEA